MSRIEVLPLAGRATDAEGRESTVLKRELAAVARDVCDEAVYEGARRAEFRTGGMSARW